MTLKRTLAVTTVLAAALVLYRVLNTNAADTPESTR